MQAATPQAYGLSNATTPMANQGKTNKWMAATPPAAFGHPVRDVPRPHAAVLLLEVLLPLLIDESLGDDPEHAKIYDEEYPA